jgi:hypothetical protein
VAPSRKALPGGESASLPPIVLVIVTSTICGI